MKFTYILTIVSTDSTLVDKYVGKKFTIIHCVGAKESFDNSLEQVTAHQRESFKRRVILQIERLADEGPMHMSRGSFPEEGALPRKKGQHKDKHFRAFKRIPIRGYCWLSDRVRGTYFISHYINKKKDKLDKSDTTKVGNNWIRIEENGDER